MNQVIARAVLGTVAVASLAACRTATPVDVERIEVTTAGGSSGDVRANAQAFLDDYHARWLPLHSATTEASWAMNTRIVEGDTTNAHRMSVAAGALAEFVGSRENIAAAQRFLDQRERLTDLQVRQFEAILYSAGGSPETAADLVQRRIALEAAQVERLFGYTFRVDGAVVSANDIDRLLRESTDLEERLAVWEASKEVGPVLTDGMEELRDLRNGVVRALGYDDYFAYQVADYNVGTEEMMARMDRLLEELQPLYRELHTWTRYELAERYGVPVPDLLPAHWLPNRWAQDWSPLVEVEGVDLDAALAGRPPEWVVEQSERFYTSLGFDPLPASFYELSSLYPLPEGAPYAKNSHASAWHMDRAEDVRSLMSVEPNTDWYSTAHHELGHIYYYMEYSTPAVPPLLRRGADRAYHEAIGSLMGLASMQPRFLEAIDVSAPAAAAPDPIQTLLKEALEHAVFIPFSAGTMSHFERDLYAGELPRDQWNARWWEYAARYQGIAPPDPARAAEGSPFNDAATKTHITNDAAQYYDYPLSTVLLFQLHHHIATEILGESPRDTNYFGRREVGDFLRGLMRPGATVDSDELLRGAVGEALSARPMVDYFAPLMDWLRQENRGRRHTI